MKKFFALLVTLVTIVSCASASYAQTTRASAYLIGYGISVEAQGNGRMEILYEIDGKGRMEKIGADALYIDYYVDGEWQSYETLLGIKNPDFYSYDALGHSDYAYFDGEPGVKYRVTLKAYAKGYDGGSDTGYVTSYEETCR